MASLSRLAADPALMVEGDFTEAGGYAAVQRLLLANPDAIFAASDMMAIGCAEGILAVPARARRLAIPKTTMSARDTRSSSPQKDILGPCCYWAFTFWKKTSGFEWVWPEIGSSALTGSMIRFRISPHAA